MSDAIDVQDEVFGVDDELDLSGESTIEAQRGDFTITDIEVQDRENGTLARVTFEGDTLPYPVTEGFWMKHSNEQAQRIGRGQLKRLFKAAFGSEKGVLNNLRGVRVNAYQKEDNDGFARLSSFRAAAESSSEEAVEL